MLGVRVKNAGPMWGRLEGIKGDRKKERVKRADSAWFNRGLLEFTSFSNRILVFPGAR